MIVVVAVGTVVAFCWLREELKIQQKYYRDLVDLYRLQREEIFLLKEKMKELSNGNG